MKYDKHNCDLIRKLTKLTAVIMAICLSFLFVACNNNGENKPYGAVGASKNVILMIGDGMGKNHIANVCGYYKLESLYLESLADYSCDVTTRSRSSDVTDSAAASTALSCGVKTDNGNVAWRDGKPLQNMAEYVQTFDMDMGVVVTESILGATPSGFGSHSPDRKHNSTLLENHLASNVKVYMGANDNISSHYDLITTSGYAYAHTTELFTPDFLSQDKIFGAFTGIAPYGDTSNELNPTLSQLSIVALDYLKNRSDNGFFMLIEGSNIDKRSHSNQFVQMAQELMGFDEAVKAVVEWARTDGNTIVIVTADHETGDLQLAQDGNYSNQLFRSENHTGQNVTAYFYGLDQRDYPSNGVLDNTDISKIIREYVANARK